MGEICWEKRTSLLSPKQLSNEITFSLIYLATRYLQHLHKVKTENLDSLYLVSLTYEDVIQKRYDFFTLMDTGERRYFLLQAVLTQAGSWASCPTSSPSLLPPSQPCRYRQLAVQYTKFINQWKLPWQKKTIYGVNSPLLNKRQTSYYPMGRHKL